jgi:hypothetical protein
VIGGCTYIGTGLLETPAPATVICTTPQLVDVQVPLLDPAGGVQIV